MTLHGLLRITIQIQRGPSLKDKPKWLHGEEPGLRCPQEHGWLQNVLENMQNAAKRRRGALWTTSLRVLGSYRQSVKPARTWVQGLHSCSGRTARKPGLLETDVERELKKEADAYVPRCRMKSTKITHPGEARGLREGLGAGRQAPGSSPCGAHTRKGPAGVTLPVAFGESDHLFLVLRSIPRFPFY